MGSTDYTNCVWTMQCPDGGTGSVTFTSFASEGGWDFLNVFSDASLITTRLVRLQTTVVWTTAVTLAVSPAPMSQAPSTELLRCSTSRTGRYRSQTQASKLH